jgi:leucyl aminopeptidase
LENLNDSEDMNRARENIKETIKISAKESLGLHELKQYKLWLHEEFSQFSDQRKQANVQCLQDPNKRNVDNLNNVRHEACRHFRNKQKEHLKVKINEFETNRTIITETCIIGISISLRKFTSLEYNKG